MIQIGIFQEESNDLMIKHACSGFSRTSPGLHPFGAPSSTVPLQASWTCLFDIHQTSQGPVDWQEKKRDIYIRYEGATSK